MKKKEKLMSVEEKKPTRFSVLIGGLLAVLFATLSLAFLGLAEAQKQTASSVHALQAELQACKARANTPLVLSLYSESTADGKEKVLICDKYPNCVDITDLIEKRAMQLSNIRFSYFFYSVRTDAEYRQIVCGDG